MPRKNNKNKKVKGLLYHKRKLILIFSLLFISIFSILLLPSKPTNDLDCANSISCISDLSGHYSDDNTGQFEGKKIAGPALADKPYKIAVNNNVLGDTTEDSKRIYVDLSKQKLYAFENNTLIHEFTISSGKPWWPTPTGDFRIWIKLRYTRMQGGTGANYYNLPNVPYTMFFYNDKVPKSKGYGIHGAYWHNNFGNPMSHGCVNMREEDVAKLYNWANPPSTKNVTYATKETPGTLITIYGTTPQ